MDRDMVSILRNLNFGQVFTFFAVIETRSFTKAAEQLNMSQAAVSRIIARLEAETNLILFVRKARESVATPAGRLLYREWKSAFREFEAGYELAYEAQLGYTKKLHIGSVDRGQNMDHMIALMDCFEKDYPEYEVTVDCDNVRVIIEKLVAGKLDFLFVNAFESRYLETMGVHCRRLFSTPCSIYIHETHPLYQKEEITRKDLVGEDYTLLGTEHLYHSHGLQEFCRHYGVNFQNLYIEAEFRQAMISFAKKRGFIFPKGFLWKDNWALPDGFPFRRSDREWIWSGETIVCVRLQLLSESMPFRFTKYR